MTDLTYYEFMQEMENDKMSKCMNVWDPNHLPESLISEYLSNIESYWPHHLYYYQEEIALLYLSLKNYDVQLALTTVLYNLDELVKLILVIKRKRVKEGMFVNMVKKQTRASQANMRVLRERKNKEDESWSSIDF